MKCLSLLITVNKQIRKYISADLTKKLQSCFVFSLFLLILSIAVHIKVNKHYTVIHCASSSIITADDVVTDVLVAINAII
uniref:Uncharacterized protein n=1 Tax=Glossina brevipalpis TaxID=37001 RepID=A0A1A9WXW8_9MUSC